MGLELVPPKLEAEFLALPNMEPGFDRELEGRFLEFVSAKLEPEFLLDPNSERGFAAGGFFVEPDLDSDLDSDLAPDLEALLAPVPNGELGFDVEPELVVVPGFDVDDDLDVEPGLIFELDPKEELPEDFVAPTLEVGCHADSFHHSILQTENNIFFLLEVMCSVYRSVEKVGIYTT